MLTNINIFSKSRTLKTVMIMIILSLLMIDYGISQSVLDMMKKSGVQGGVVVHLGCNDGKETVKLRLNDRYIVQGLEKDNSKIHRARDYIHSKKMYGTVSVYKLKGKVLPFHNNMVNLLIAENKYDISKEEILRVLVPDGVAYIKNGSKWDKVVKPRPKDIGEWKHYLNGPDNNAVAQDTVTGEPRGIQWLSEPRWGRSHEELNSMSAAVTANGRMFFIVDEGLLATLRFPAKWKLVARDAFNGTLFWKKDIPVWTDHLRHFRSGPVHLTRRLVAHDDEVYVTLGLAAPLTALDAATGDILRTYKGTEYTDEIIYEKGVLYLVVGTSEADRKGGGLFERKEPKPSGFRFIAAFKADTGKQLWKKTFSKDEYIMPLSLAVKNGKVFCQTSGNMVCLDGKSGKDIWKTKRATVKSRMGFSAPTLVVTDDVVLCADLDPAARKNEGPTSKKSPVFWGVHGWNEDGFDRKGKSRLRVYSVKDGKELWDVDCQENYNSPTDIFVIDGLAYIGNKYNGYDLKTGEVKREISTKKDKVGMSHHRCYRDKASLNHLFLGNSGIEMIDLKKGHWTGNNSWIRGTCQYGVIPANGLIYAPPDACGCFPRVKVPGFFAATPKKKIAFDKKVERLEKGPSYGKIKSGGSNKKTEWPMFRQGIARGSSVETKIPTNIKQKWKINIGGRLSQPVIAGGKIYVSSVNAYTIHVLDEKTGKKLWSYTAGGRVDSSPTIYKGMVLFGSSDGHVYCLKAEDGTLAWRFQVAVEDKQIGAYDRIESIWPVHGAVLVQNDTVYAAAGRNTYLDGGLFLVRIDPYTGKELSRTRVTDLDPVTGKQTGPELKMDMIGSVNDVLIGDGDSVFIKHLRFDKNGKQVMEEKMHLFSVTSMLVEEWFIRSYWLHGVTTGAGWGGWAAMGNYVPAGRILCFDNENIYGYGRKEYAGAGTGHRALDFYMYGMKKKMDVVKMPPKAKRNKKKKGKKGKKGASAEESTPPAKPAPVIKKPDPREHIWTQDESLIVRAMVKASDQLVVAGPPDVSIRVKSEILAFENEDDAVAGFEGKKGVFLRIISVKDGSKISETKLSALPVFDGMSAANNKVFISLKDGTLECWGK